MRCQLLSGPDSRRISSAPLWASAAIDAGIEEGIDLMAVDAKRRMPAQGPASGALVRGLGQQFGSSKMSARYVAAICVMILGAAALAPSAFAQQKTAKACADEWRANKAANQAAGKTEKAYVAECRGAAAQTTPTPTTAPAAAPAPAPTVSPKVAAPTRPTSPKPAPTAASSPTGAGEFLTEAAAKAHCPADTVVWANTNSKIYHFSDNRNYGNTKSGAYMCEKDTAAAGIRAAKNEKHP